MQTANMFHAETHTHTYTRTAQQEQGVRTAWEVLLFSHNHILDIRHTGFFLLLLLPVKQMAGVFEMHAVSSLAHKLVLTGSGCANSARITPVETHPTHRHQIFTPFKIPPTRACITSATVH